MGLKGSIPDFAIAEIFQLLGQQTKTGILHLRREHEEVHVAFDEGAVVAAERISRKSLLGTRMVRAGLLQQEQLDEALAIQKRTLQRLGDVLVQRGAIHPDDLREMLDLHVREIVYELFTWKSGSYSFEPTDVSWDRETVTPLRCESILMEAFRLVDEWPLVRRTIHSFDLIFERVRPLPAPPPEDPASRSLHLGEVDEKIGAAERRVMELTEPGRSVTRIIDLSRLGKFETCKALATLVNEGYLRAKLPPPPEPARRSSLRDWWSARSGKLLGVALWAGGLAALAALAAEGQRARPTLEVPTQSLALQQALGQAQQARLRHALEVHRFETGAYPERLEALVESGLLSEADLRYPWREPYAYDLAQGSQYALWAPLR